jgi:hypothetical protein
MAVFVEARLDDNGSGGWSLSLNPPGPWKCPAGSDGIVDFKLELGSARFPPGTTWWFNYIEMPDQSGTVHQFRFCFSPGTATPQKWKFRILNSTNFRIRLKDRGDDNTVSGASLQVKLSALVDIPPSPLAGKKSRKALAPEKDVRILTTSGSGASGSIECE